MPSPTPHPALSPVSSPETEPTGTPAQCGPLRCDVPGWGNTPEYFAWRNMIRRCEDARVEHFASYGGRGIKVWPLWRASFAAFLADVGSRPAAGYSLDRPETNGHYQPGNVRWATRLEQARNMRTNRLVTARGETLTIAEWCERTGQNKNTVFYRLTHGWPDEAAIFAPAEPSALGRAPRFRKAS